MAATFITKIPVATDQAPKALGPYSQGIISNNMIFCSGQLPIDPATGKFVPGDIYTQTHRVIQNLSGVLQAAGSSLSNVVKTTVFLRDMDDFDEMNKAYEEAFAHGIKPARAAVQVARLPKDANIEIDCVATLM
ncbi:hypothetical protein DFQ26_008448 [Actinomortierella ambigua]|nr:hypothetical protein DFQ26_008448 [Actinomortierella ambigua]